MTFQHRLNRSLHKYSGLACLPLFLLLAISGILLNHPEWVRNLSIPGQFLPVSHQYDNWNRAIWRTTVRNGDHIYVGGKAGVWYSSDGGSHFSPLQNGYPANPYDQDTFSLIRFHSEDSADLFAGTRRGLYRYDEGTNRWTNIPFPGKEVMAVADLSQVGDRLLVFTQQSCYVLRASADELETTAFPLSFAPQDEPQTTRLFQILLRLHSGAILGPPGGLLVDIGGLILVFLCTTGILIWLLRRRRLPLRRLRSSLSWMYRKHLSLGILFLPLLIVITLTGVLIRPPFLTSIASLSVPAKVLSAQNGSNWIPRIDKVHHQPQTNSLLLATRAGFFSGPDDFSTPFVKLPINVPHSSMGVTVMAEVDDTTLLIGSFRGLYLWNRDTLTSEPVFSRQR